MTPNSVLVFIGDACSIDRKEQSMSLISLQVSIISSIFSSQIRDFGHMTTDIITIRELAAYLKMAEKTLYRLAAEGAVPGFKVGGAWRFRKSEIDKWIARQERLSA